MFYDANSYKSQFPQVKNMKIKKWLCKRFFLLSILSQKTEIKSVMKHICLISTFYRIIFTEISQNTDFLISKFYSQKRRRCLGKRGHVVTLT